MNRLKSDMKRPSSLLLAALASVAIHFFAAPQAAAQGTTAFTYQGRLTDNGAPATGQFDLRFALRDAQMAGNPVGTPIVIDPVTAENGVFTVALDFGPGIFDGTPRWLEIEVRPNGSADPYDLLTPRQRITPAPYALWAGGVNASSIVGQVTDNQISSTQSTPKFFTHPDNEFAGKFTGDGSMLTGINATSIDAGIIADSRIDAAIARSAAVWSKGGDAGTTPDADFVGTTDDQPLDLKANGRRALRV